MNNQVGLVFVVGCCSAKDSVQQSVFTQEAEAELGVGRGLGHGQSLLGRIACSVGPGSAVVGNTQRSHYAHQVLTIRRHVRSIHGHFSLEANSASYPQRRDGK